MDLPFIEVKAFFSFIRMKENVFKIAVDSLSFTRMKDSLTRFPFATVKYISIGISFPRTKALFFVCSM